MKGTKLLKRKFLCTSLFSTKCYHCGFHNYITGQKPFLKMQVLLHCLCYLFSDQCLFGNCCRHYSKLFCLLLFLFLSSNRLDRLSCFRVELTIFQIGILCFTIHKFDLTELCTVLKRLFFHCK